MGRGGAVGGSSETFQVPRLTSVLRALAGKDFDVDAQQLARQRTLQQSQQKQPAPLLAAKRSPLALTVLGVWEKAPKAARDLYAKFAPAVSHLLGGEVPPADLADICSMAWETLCAAPPPLPMRGMPSKLVMGPTKALLSAAVGPVDDEALLLELVNLVAALKEWQAKLNPKASAAGGQVGLLAGAGADADLPAEFGADLDFWFVDSDAPAPAAAAAAAAPAAPAASAPAEAGSSGGGGGGGGGAVLSSSAHAFRDMFRETAEAAERGAAGPSGGNMFSLFGEEEEDLGADYEDKKRVREINLHWLQRWMERATADSDGSSTASLLMAVCHILLTDTSGESLATQLVDLLGFGAAEVVSELMEHRKPLTAALRLAIAKVRAYSGADDAAAGGGAAMPSYGASVTVNSKSQKLLAKLALKEQRKGAKGAGARGGDVDVEVDTLLSTDFEELVDTERDHSSTLVLGEGVEFAIGGGNAGSGGARGAALPKGTTRKSFKEGYEEVHVPAPPRAPPPEPGELVQIVDMEDWAQLAFAGYKTLNRIQSRIYKTAFNSNENILVCAPTGAGKTNIAMIAVLREVGANMRHGVIQKGDFKIVYVAPMKALAAEVTANFSKRLQPLGLLVRELTGDMQLTKKELTDTQMIVTTPEKWDVITRKGGDVSIAALVKLLIIDEVHLLNDDRGPVIETLIARTLRLVEASQTMIRIVGLSATLPNYIDVASFLHVNPASGLFYFDASFRPVPLQMQFVGVSESHFGRKQQLFIDICYRKVIESLKAGNQVMVFVHSRKDTGKTARALAEEAGKHGESHLLDTREHPHYLLGVKDMKKARSREVSELFDSGFGIHNAGLPRPDRTMTERLFADGLIKVLVCTATLAWGVNLPAHTVVIKGTQVYNPQKGGFDDLGMLDVQQIFGRAGRPQFDTSGEGIIITSHNKLAHYLSMLTHQIPIESQFKTMLVDNLNAEIVLGTVTNIREAATWLSYTYMSVRMSKNPLAYALTWDQVLQDPSLESHKRALVTDSARVLKTSQMATFDEKSGNLYVTELGRIASHFYIRHQSMVIFKEGLHETLDEAGVLALMAQSSEFEQLQVREDELPELEQLLKNAQACPYEVKGGMENKTGKAHILMQAYVSRARVDSFSLIADMMYVANNAPRIVRAIFEVCLRRKWSHMAETCLSLCKAFEKRLWHHQHPLRQFEHILSFELLAKLEERRLGVDELYDMTAADIGAALRHPAVGATVRACMDNLPALELGAQLQPITRTVLRIQLTLQPIFTWNERVHGGSMRWLIWVEDSATGHLYHSEIWVLTKKMMSEPVPQLLAFTLPIHEPLSSQYYVRALPENWFGGDAHHTISFAGLVLPEKAQAHTELLDLDPLPASALGNAQYEALYDGRFTHFNPIQTQAFHTLYHTDENVLLGAPTGSGKTVSAELAMLRLFTAHPEEKVIYIAPLKALVRERIEEWGSGLCKRLGKKMVELTGDYTPDLRALLAADIIICTPEKWDGISRNWQSRGYVKKVGLLVIDEIHLLGADRGPILEVIVSRMRYIAAQMERHIRFVGLSTALANAQDLGDWLGISSKGLFNFKPSVRPVPLECHIQGYPGKFYCPRMATMNKPTYMAIQTHSPHKPVIVFVSSRRQTRITALDLITYAVGDERPQQFVRMADEELENAVDSVRDANLRHTLQFGIGMHHAGLNDRDRSIVEKLFLAQKIQILVATSTLAWGVNTPAHLVVIKGTEYYDAPLHRYTDFPITDVLQMMGRAGRPQFDKQGVAVIMVHEPKKQFYKRFLYEPFPVESSLHTQIADHFNAEVVAGTISSKQDAVDYVTWTFLFRRLLQNPAYYDLPGTGAEQLSAYLSDLVEGALRDLEEAGCVALLDDDGVAATATGRIASFYYLGHATMTVFTRNLRADMEVKDLLQVMCGVTEYDELPVRHNEDKTNAELSREVRYAIDVRTADDPHTKANLLMQMHMSRLAAPVCDYVTDTKTVLDQCLRILQAMVDVSADAGWLVTAMNIISLVQSLMQGVWWDDNAMLMLPYFDAAAVKALESSLGVKCLPQLLEALDPASPKQRAAFAALSTALGSNSRAQECAAVCERLPIVELRTRTLAEEPGKAEGSGSPGWTVEVDVTRMRTGRRGGGGGGGGAPGAAAAGRARVYAPRFPKVKEEGWYLLLGDASTHELLALKRISVEHKTTVRMTVPFANGAGVRLTGVRMLLMSDSYVGLDQQREVALEK